jgi:uncharacterized protein (DUF342 family)
MNSKVNLNDPATKGDIARLDSRMDKTDSRLEIMAQQLDWLYHKELNKEEQGLIHDNRHEEVEDKLINHENRIVKVEGFVQMVKA